MKPYFFFDLDGPILDVSEKYYRVYKDILESWPAHPLPKTEFWDAKRSQTPIPDILMQSGVGARATEYAGLRLDRIETQPYWRFDRLQDGAPACLEELGASYRLALVTLRQSRTELMSELEHFDLARHFEAVLSGDGETEPRWRSKYDMVAGYLSGMPPDGSWFIGDTDTDILAGKALGCRTIGVLSGIRNRDLLETAGPEFIIDDIRSLNSIVAA